MVPAANIRQSLNEPNGFLERAESVEKLKVERHGGGLRLTPVASKLTIASFALAKVSSAASLLKVAGRDVCGRASAVARTRTGQRLGLTAGITRAAVLLAEARGRMSRCWAWVGQRPVPTRCSLACRRSALLRKARYGETQADCIPQTAEECAWLDGLTEGQFGRMLIAWCDKDLRIGIGQWISAGY